MYLCLFIDSSFQKLGCLFRKFVFFRTGKRLLLKELLALCLYLIFTLHYCWVCFNYTSSFSFLLLVKYLSIVEEYLKRICLSNSTKSHVSSLRSPLLSACLLVLIVNLALHDGVKWLRMRSQKSREQQDGLVFCLQLLPTIISFGCCFLISLVHRVVALSNTKKNVFLPFALTIEACVGERDFHVTSSFSCQQY